MRPLAALALLAVAGCAAHRPHSEAASPARQNPSGNTVAIASGTWPHGTRSVEVVVARRGDGQLGAPVIVSPKGFRPDAPSGSLPIQKRDGAMKTGALHDFLAEWKR